MIQRNVITAAGRPLGRLLDAADRWIEGEPIAGFVAIGACVLAAALCPMDRFHVAVWPLSALVVLTIVRMVQRWRTAARSGDAR